MAQKLCISFNWQGPMDYDQACARVRAADEVGVNSSGLPSAWGRDCFTILAILARRLPDPTWDRDCEYVFSHSCGTGTAFRNFG